MSNVTSLMTSPFSNQTSMPSLDELLDQLGFGLWETVVNTFILPPINLIGIALCSFSLWIFSRPSFEDPIFFYYKLLCLVNIILLLHNIPSCILFTPIYFPWINTYATSVYQWYYASVSNILFHYADVLRMGILLAKMKLYVPFVHENFSARPQINSLTLFLTCFLIDAPTGFGFKIKSLGNYFYLDSKGVKQTTAFYYLTWSDFSQTLFGKILLGLTGFFFSVLVTLLVGVVLNILSYIKYKSYSRKRQREFEELQMSSIHNRPTTNREIEQLRHREKIDHKIERNMFRMALTLCSLTIVSRFLFAAIFIYFFIFSSFSNTLLIEVSSTSLYTFSPTVSILVFYSFNKMFRDETNTKLFRRQSRPYPRIVFISHEVQF